MARDSHEIAGKTKMKVGLPVRPFLYTMDQIATILSLDPDGMYNKNFIYFKGRSIGTPTRQKMTAVNISEPGQHPEWRVSEYELLRWMRVKGFKYYDRGVTY